MTIDPVYILIRTSNRPNFFGRMMETIKEQSYPNVVTIVHTDDPRDKYVEGDIIIRGSAYGPEFGNGSYNLYNNRLLKAIPDGPGWFHFIDDDDEYAGIDVIAKFVNESKKDHVNVARVQRWKQTIWPRKWRNQRSFQTECFLVHTDHKNRAKWWGHKGGDHNYSKKLTKRLPINWIEHLLVCKAQEGKGHGKKLDKGGRRLDYSDAFKPYEKVTCIGLYPINVSNKNNRIAQGEIKKLRYDVAQKFERMGKVKITHESSIKEKAPPRNMLNI